MKAYIFPGQGSQFKGMGAELFDEFPDYIEKADNILGYSVKELCLNDQEHKLSQTQYTQPMLYVVNALTYLKKLTEDSIPADYVAGHSLGEYNALFAARVFDFETGLKLVKKRGELMSQAPEGGMAAVLGCTLSTVESVLSSHDLESIDIANINTTKQIVISGLKSDIDKAKDYFQSENTNYYPLNVSAPFHSRYMESAAEKFKEFLESYTFADPDICVISNVKARPHRAGMIKEYLRRQIVSSVQWVDSIRYLMGKRVTDYVELGPGDVLTKMTAIIRKKEEPLYVDVSPDAGDSKTNTKNEEKMSSESIKTAMPFSAKYLGSADFKKDYGLEYACLAGGMYKGISSKELVVSMGNSGFMGFYGSGGVKLSQVDECLKYIRSKLENDKPYGMNLVSTPNNPDREQALVDLCLRNGVKVIEAATFMQITPALVHYRLKGLHRDDKGRVITKNKIIVKISRPEIAKLFLTPAPEWVVEKLLKKKVITPAEAELCKEVPMADDLCVEADSAGHTDMGVTAILLPTIIRLRDEICSAYSYKQKVRVGSAGGIGTPEAAASSFVMGADFILTGSINQCTVEADTSDVVKDMLQKLNVQDTDYAPAGDMFELGSKVQVMKLGVFFPARANKLYDLWRNYHSLEDIDPSTIKQLEENYFNRSIEQVYSAIKEHYKDSPQIIYDAEKNPKKKMALIFRSYFVHSSEIARKGSEPRVNYQVHTGPSMGAFNQWVKGTALENWRNRHVEQIGKKLMNETADYLNKMFKIKTAA
jgi:trans-AT polyketide synthase/acyltransferase/oxidoreductase domain-containing protein